MIDKIKNSAMHYWHEHKVVSNCGGCCNYRCSIGIVGFMTGDCYELQIHRNSHHFTLFTSDFC